MLYDLGFVYYKIPVLPEILTNCTGIVAYSDFPAYTLISNVSKKGHIRTNIQPFTVNGVR